MEPSNEPSRFTFFRVSGTLALFTVLISGASYYLYSQSRSTPEQAQQKETKSMLAAVGKLMVLPDNEDPIIATVADPEKLKDQPFFVKAKKGDKVLIYNKARKAILYDPVANHIIDVAPLSIGGQATPTQ